MPQHTTTCYHPFSDIGITCGSCGHSDHIDRFTATPIGGALPPGTYQCPACNVAIRIRTAAEGASGIFEGSTYLDYPDHPDGLRTPDDRLIRVPAHL